LFLPLFLLVEWLPTDEKNLDNGSVCFPL
jgi:hypothetical protein